MATTLFVPCVFKEGLEVVFEGVVATVFFAKEFLALEEGEDNRVAIFALAELSFFLCFFSSSFSPLKERKQKLHVARHRLTYICLHPDTGITHYKKMTELNSSAIIPFIKVTVQVHRDFKF